MVDTYVVYLVWPPMGSEPLDRFAASYRQHHAGLDHRLVLVLKGSPDGPIAAQSRSTAHRLSAEHVQVPAVGRDLDTYRHVAERLRGNTLCLLNSSSELVAPGWLGALRRALEQPGAGLVGATGSYESALSAAPRPLRPVLRRRFPPFPNPHIRTNAFMLRRELMLELDWPRRRGKRRALELESGTRGITRQVLDRGLRALVVGRDGHTYEPDRWPQSRTFRNAGQENLLIADNRTRQYAQAEGARRTELAAYAWGAQAGQPRTALSTA